MIYLCYTTDDPHGIELLNAYWERQPNGKMAYTLKDLCTATGTRNASALADWLAEYGYAVDLDAICPHCTGPHVQRQRGVPVLDGTPCPCCMAAKQAVHDRERERRLVRIRNNAAVATCAYGQISDRAAVWLMALNRLLADEGFAARFTGRSLAPLAPGQVLRYTALRDLLAASVIVERFEGEAKEYALSGEHGLSYSMDTMRFAIAPDRQAGEAFPLAAWLRDRPFRDRDALYELWREGATQDVMAYLLQQMDLHQVALSADEWTECEGIVFAALDSFSVAELWFMVWKVPRDAAALASRPYYNREKASATIPGKLRRAIAAANDGSAQRREWTRHQDLPACVLAEVFLDRFGIADTTRGPQAYDRLCEATTPAAPAPDADWTAQASAEQRLQATEIMRQALAKDVATEVFCAMAMMQAEGRPYGDALDFVTSALSGPDETAVGAPASGAAG